MTSTALDPNTKRENALVAVTQAGTEADRLIGLWLEHKNASALVEISTRGTGKARKAARRALKVLKSRGVSIPKEKRIAKLGGSSEPGEKAWLLAPDPAMNSLLVLAERHTSGRFRAALVFLNDGYGVTQVQQGEFSQSGLKKTIESVAPAARYKPTEVDVAWARSRIHEALKSQRERKLVEPLGLMSISDLLKTAPDKPVAHPFDSEGLEVAPEDARDMSRDSGELHMLPEFRAWLPSRGSIDEMLQDVGKNMTPDEQPAQERMQELLRAGVVRATDRYFTPEVRKHLVGVMKDSALSVLAREGESTALRVAATMQCIENAGLITDPPSDVPFLKTFFDKAVAYLLAEGKGSLQIPIPRGAASAADATAAAPENDSGLAPVASGSAETAGSDPEPDQAESGKPDPG
jgi:hypothetical protein